MTLFAVRTRTATRSLAVVALLLAALLGTLLVPAEPAQASSGVSTGGDVGMEALFLDLLNAERARNGLPAMRRVAGVDNVAREWSDVMARDNQLKHRSNLRAPFTGSWQRLGENVGVGFSAPSLHKAFMDSPGHRANVLGDYDRVGIGVALAGTRAWVTFNFVKGDPSTKAVYRNDPLRGSYATGSGTSGPYRDLSGSVHARDIERLDGAGAAISCASQRYCPDTPLKRSEMAALLTRALDLPPATERFVDVPSGHRYAAEIGALAKAGITLGCNPPANDRFCPEDHVTRQQMASFIVRALDLQPLSTRPFGDVTRDNVHANDIAALERAGITLGCNPPSNTRYCPGHDVTRAQMASFLVRALDL